MPITDSILDRAADLWVVARRGGVPHGDADLIFAATALHLGQFGHDIGRDYNALGLDLALEVVWEANHGN
jgi:predicted nucleic acid-binding protein